MQSIKNKGLNAVWEKWGMFIFGQDLSLFSDRPESAWER